MAFPEDKLGLVVEIQPGGVWTDITAKCKTAEPIVHARGIRNKASLAEPATVPLKIDNKDGAFSPRNPLSPHDLKLNTPVRLWLPDGDHFLDLDGNPANYASTPDDASLDITGDLDLRWEGEANWYGPGAQILIGKWGDIGQRSYHMRLQDGALYMQVQIDADTFVWAAHPLPELPDRAAVRTVLDADNGAGGWSMSHYWAPTIAGPWTQIAETFSNTSIGPITVHVSTAPLKIAPDHPSATPPRQPVDGKVYAAQVWGAGILVANPDFEAQPIGAAPFADSVGRTWSYSGTAAIADRQDVFIGEISSWPQRWVPSEEAVWTPVQASGILRRLGQGQKPLDSTLRRRIPSGNPIAYWPFEEDSDASSAYSPIAGVAPAAVTGVEWAAVDTLASSKALPKLTAAATLSAIVPEATAGEWQMEMVYNADDKVPPAAETHAEVISISTTGTVRRWVIGMRDGQARIWGYDASGTDIAFKSVAVGGDVFHGWVRLRFWARDTGSGTVEYQISWQDIGGAAGVATDTVTGSAGRVSAVTANWGAATEGWAIGHLAVLPASRSTLYDGSDRAYSGETAWERMRRLAGEEGVPMARIPGELTPELVGPQRVAKLLEVFQAAADADGGMLLEDRNRIGLVYRDRSSMYTQEPALNLAYKQPPLTPPLEPDDDADVTRNDRSVKRDGGSEARAVLKEGRLSILAPPNGIGLYDDSVTLSLASDTQAEPIAYWLLHLGTYDGARYPSVTIRLHRAPGLIPDVLAMREGDLIRIKDLPGFVAYGDVDLIVTGWTETLKPRWWERTFVCEPGGPWNLAVADHPVFGKADTDGSELAGAIAAADTTVPIRTTAGDMWVTANPVLNANPDFETGLEGWSGFDAVIERVPTPAGAPFRSDWSMQVTPNGTGQFPNAGSEMLPIVPGLDYVLSGWLRCTTSRNVALNANWFDAGFGYITTSANDQAVTADTWTWFEATFTAPAGVAWANLSPTVPNFPPATDVLLCDKITWRRAGGMPREFPIDLQAGGEVIRATAIAPRTLNTNPELITDAAGWTGQNAGATRSVAEVHPDAVASLFIAPDGVSAEGGAIATDASPVGNIVEGRQYTCSMWAYTAGGWPDLQPCVDWLDAAGGYLSTGFLAGGFAVPAATWTFLTQTFTAPANASRASMRARHAGTPSQAQTWFAWDIRLTAVSEQTATVQRSVNGVTKAHAIGTAVRLAFPAIASL